MIICSPATPKRQRERQRGEEAAGPLGLRRSEKNGPSECWPNYFLLGQHKNARGGIGQKWGWEQEVFVTKYGSIGFISIPFGTYTLIGTRLSDEIHGHSDFFLCFLPSNIMLVNVNSLLRGDPFSFFAPCDGCGSFLPLPTIFPSIIDKKLSSFGLVALENNVALIMTS